MLKCRALPLSIKMCKEIACISEAIRTEGNIVTNFQGITISNTNLFLLNKLEKSIKFLFQNKARFSRILHIYMWLQPKDSIIEIKNEVGKPIKRFTIRKFKNKNDNILTFVDSVNSLNFIKCFKIKLKNRLITLNAKSEDYKIKINSENHIKTTSYLQDTFYNAAFARFLHHNLEIQIGRKSYNIFLPKILKNADEDILKEIVGIVTSCEGNIGNYKKSTRLITIKIGSKKYLIGILKLLNKFGVNSRICKVENKLWALKISRKKNLENFYKTFKLFHSEKIKELKTLISSYSKNKIAHWEADRFYLTSVNKFGPITSEKLAKILDKSSDHIRFRLKKLFEEDYLKRTGGKCYGYYRKRDPFIYSITKAGIRLIDS